MALQSVPRSVADDADIERSRAMLGWWFHGCTGGVVAATRDTGDRWPSDFIETANVEHLAPAVAGYGTMFPTYVRVSTMTRRPDRPGGRGGNAHALELPGLYADIDGAHGAHKTSDPLPETLDVVRTILAGLPAPSVVVDSGGGWHLYWKCTHPLPVDVAAAAQQRWGTMIAERFAAAGLHVDKLTDLARVMRWPGTYNTKTGDSRPVSVIDATGELHDIDQLLAHAPVLEQPEPTPLLHLADIPGSDDPHPMQALRGMGHEGHRFVASALVQQGWTLAADTGTYIDLVRPGGSSERSVRLGGTHPDSGDDMTGQAYAFSGAIPGVEGTKGYTIGGLLAAAAFDGDDRRCNDWLVEHGIGEPLVTKADPSEWITKSRALIAEQRAVERGPVEVFWADEVALDPPPPIDELVTNLVAVGEVTVFGAPRAMGKTWATMGLAAMVATGVGMPFGCRRFVVTRPATVVYLQGELGRSSSHVRWRLATGGRPPHVAEVFERLRVKTTARRTTHRDDDLSWTDEESVAVVDDRLEPLLTELGCELLVIDPWATYFAGNENSNDEVESAIDAITQMARRVGCAVWIVHHITAKATHGTLAEPEDLWRGASRLADAVATRVTLLPHYTPTRAKELGLDRFEARTFGDLHVLQRNGPPVPLVHTQLVDHRWQDWTPTNPDGGRPAALSDRDIVAVLSHGPIESKRKLADAVGASVSALDRHLERLIATSVVVIEPGPRGAKGYRLNGGGLP